MRRRPDYQLLKVVALFCAACAGVVGAQPSISAPSGDPKLIESAAPAETAAGAAALSAPTVVRGGDALAGAEPDNGAEILRAEVRGAHPWTRFEPGAWRRLRMVTESFNAAGESTGLNASERVERLLAVDGDTYTIEVENLAPIAGHATPGAVESRHLSMLTDRSAGLGSPAIEEVEPTTISFGDVVVPCRTWRVSIADQGAVEEELLCVAVGSDPAVLRRKLSTTVGGTLGATVTSNVSRLDLPALYGERLVRSWHLTTTIAHPAGGRTERTAVFSAEAPGGLHWEAAADYDASGRRTFWSVIDLVESGRTAVERVEAADRPTPPAVSVEVHSRRLMRLLRRDERRDDRRSEPAPEPMQ